MVLFIGNRNIKNKKFGIIHWKLEIWYYSLETKTLKIKNLVLFIGNLKFGIIHWKRKTLKIKILVLFIGNRKHLK